MTKSVHFIGIGGIGMSGIAQILLKQGHHVSGSDIKESSQTQCLRKLGAHITIGHSPDNLKGNPETVVYSSAIQSDNSELSAALTQNIPVVKRALVLADLMQDKISIAVAGAHGKTTTTSMVSCMLNQAKFFPTVVAGGIVVNFNGNAMLGKSNYFVAEMDESDGSFLYFHPTYSIVTNIDYEHVDFYHDWSSILKAYGTFLNQTKPEGCLFACYDNEHIRTLLKDYDKKYISFGLSEGSDIRADTIRIQHFTTRFNCICRGDAIGEFLLPVPGRHNVSNALSVIALGIELGIPVDDIRESLASYKGVERRFQIKSHTNDITLIDDYGHHPTEIKATLEALNAENEHNSIVVFQPHRYTRTKFLFDEFVQSLSLAKRLIITDIYPASELPIEGVSAKNIYNRIKDLHCNDVEFVAKEDIVEHVVKMAHKGDYILTLGAGDIGKVSDELLSRIKTVS
ncbi:UDP-N-acetylmuramate--L-alanine ligase [Candidatus Omnitrophota bacterium]